MGRLQEIRHRDTQYPELTNPLMRLLVHLFYVNEHASCYWHMMCQGLTEKCIWNSLFQFKCIPFGLENNPASVQYLMDIAFSDLQWEFCLGYLDDVIVCDKLFKEPPEKN